MGNAHGGLPLSLALHSGSSGGAFARFASVRRINRVEPIRGEFKRSSQHLEEELRWRQSGAEERIEFYVDGCVHQAVRRWDAASIGRGSGKR